jgi:hypothetical protein
MTSLERFDVTHHARATRRPGPRKESTMRGTRSFHVLVLATTAALAACAAELPPPVPTTPEPAQTAAAPASTPPPAETAAAEPAKPPEAAKPPPAPAKAKLVGRFVQDFSGEVKESAEAAAKKTAGPRDADGKKYQAALDKAAATVAQNTLENTPDTIVWSVKGKVAHKVGFEVAGKADDPASITLKLAPEKRASPKGVEVTIAFTDDDTFTLKDPFAKDPKKAQLLVFKRTPAAGG